MKKIFKYKNITFTNFLTEVAVEYSPRPASKFIPDWYKKMPVWIGKKQNPDSTPTIKKCIPVLDAITAGYIIPTPCDIYVVIEDGEPVYKTPQGQNFIQSHPTKQAHLHPLRNDFPFPKWINPWSIKTPKGYSVLFVPPMHNSNPWFEILPGFVDTDTYTNPVNFPFVLKDPTKECLIPAGTPMVQLIPIKRENWQHSFSENKKNQRNLYLYINSQFFDRYKRMFWNRKEYK
jgi:hypothetical protein